LFLLAITIWSFLTPVQIEVLPWLWLTLLCLVSIAGLIIYRTVVQAINRQKQLTQQLQAACQRLQAQNQELTNQNQSLQRHSHLKDEFLINTTHELRTPLNGIIGLTESLLEGVAGEVTPEQAKNLTLINRSSYRLSDLVNDILDFSQMQFRRLELQLQPVAAQEVTEVVVTVSKILLTNKEVELVNRIPLDLPPVKADPDRLQQILYNLVGNAIKFTSQGSIEISAALIPPSLDNSLPVSSPPSLTLTPESNNLLETLLTIPAASPENLPCPPQYQKSIPLLAITVRDTGMGIPEDQQEQIFQSFAQADLSCADYLISQKTSNSRDMKNISSNMDNNSPGGNYGVAKNSRSSSGYGLGLSITKQLVEIHGGNIWVESSIGQGAAFTFTLPLDPTPQVPPPSLKTSIKTLLKHQVLLDDQSDKKAELRLLSKLSPNPRQQGMPQYKILVVDDDSVSLQVISNYLREYDYAIDQALNGKEALEIISKGFTPDLILLDVVMPEMSGYELCQRIRAQFPADELPIIMLTGRGQVSDLVEGLNLGANDYLTKPIAKNELLARISTQLYLSQLNLAYSRFVPRQFLQLLQKESILDVQLGDQVQKEMSILFADIRDFTTLSEQMSLPENFKFINSYLSRMEPEIIAHHGFIDKYIGDALMALFSGSTNGLNGLNNSSIHSSKNGSTNSSTNSSTNGSTNNGLADSSGNSSANDVMNKAEIDLNYSSADDAVRAGISMLETLKEYNQHRGNSGYAPIKIGIGINTGSLMLGTVGGKNRMDSTVISDAVNLASRLEGLTKEYSVPLLISHHTFWELSDANSYCIRLIDRVQVKGKSEWIAVNEVFDADPPEIRDGKLATLTIFMEAWLLYNQNKLVEATKVFQECLRQNPGDQVVQVYLDRCQRSLRIAKLKANLDL
jgi:signal transduction histidine kinase/class 3 adenylate cyclase/ActR/RegA family two-component response regulator